jgi:hypothetical protein
LTVTVADCPAVPPGPVQVRVYVVVLVGWTCWEPLVARTPAHPPLAVQLVAWLLDHVRVLASPVVIMDGLAESVTAGAPLSPVGLEQVSPAARIRSGDINRCINCLSRWSQVQAKSQGRSYPQEGG